MRLERKLGYSLLNASTHSRLSTGDLIGLLVLACSISFALGYYLGFTQHGPRP